MQIALAFLAKARYNKTIFEYRRKGEKSMAEKQPVEETKERSMEDAVLWKDRKHFMWFPFSFTKYYVRRNRLYVERGLLNSVQDQTLLYRIIDIQLRRSLAQKLFGTGTIMLVTKADMNRELLLENIRHPQRVNDFLSDLIEQVRREKQVVGKEFFSSDHPHASNADWMEELDSDGDGIPDWEDVEDDT